MKKFLLIIFIFYVVDVKAETIFFKNCYASEKNPLNYPVKIIENYKAKNEFYFNYENLQKLVVLKSTWENTSSTILNESSKTYTIRKNEYLFFLDGINNSEEKYVFDLKNKKIFWESIYTQDKYPIYIFCDEAGYENILSGSKNILKKILK